MPKGVSLLHSGMGASYTQGRLLNRTYHLAKVREGCVDGADGWYKACPQEFHYHILGWVHPPKIDC